MLFEFKNSIDASLFLVPETNPLATKHHIKCLKLTPLSNGVAMVSFHSGAPLSGQDAGDAAIVNIPPGVEFVNTQDQTPQTPRTNEHGDPQFFVFGHTDNYKIIYNGKTVVEFIAKRFSEINILN